jgi:Copine
MDAPIGIKVYDHEKSGKHVIMGHAETTVNQMIQLAVDGTSRPIQLSIGGKNTGSLFVLQAEVAGLVAPSAPLIEQMSATSISLQPPGVVASSEPATSETATAVRFGSVLPMAPPPSAPEYSSRSADSSSQKDLFVDYISGGCELNVVVAIDFTGSNGDPRIPGTLHHIDPNTRNPYEQAIAANVSILLQYDSDKKVPVLGFGAKYGGVVRHCFQCGPTPEADGLQGVMDAYKATFSSDLILSRPTVLNEVLEAAARKADASFKYALQRGVQSYTILLIVTDGAVSNVHATAECLNRVSISPLSVVIVGVGNEDFKAMQFLDDCADQSGTRDIAQFVAFNEHSHRSQSLTKATLEEIPRQLVQFFQGKGIDPLPPIIRGDESIANFGEAEDEIDLGLEINEDQIVITTAGAGLVNGFNAGTFGQTRQ